MLTSISSTAANTPYVNKINEIPETIKNAEKPIRSTVRITTAAHSTPKQEDARYAPIQDAIPFSLLLC